jgi:two-component system nitrate/nitrite sensor histidine kinase NarQ
MRAEVTEAERRRIARELHDTLGQNLGYLRLRLDQLTGDDALQEVAAIQQELVRMRGIADEAYNQMRGTLATLHPSNSGDLGAALLAQVKLVGDRANFEVELTSEGKPRALSALTQHQVLYLFQEALTNVARHSQAQHVGINLTWGVDDLTVILSDDGQGFEANTLQPDGHFGLTIMQERAEEINGSLTITSRPRAGTEITLWLPTT